jgi:hypothetical protein
VRDLKLSRVLSCRVARCALERLFRQFVRRIGRTLGGLAVWQAPLITLPLKGQQPPAAKSEFVLVSVSWHANRDFILGNVAVQSTAEFVPQAKKSFPSSNSSPVEQFNDECRAFAG